MNARLIHPEAGVALWRGLPCTGRTSEICRVGFEQANVGLLQAGAGIAQGENVELDRPLRRPG
eukprot:832524-Alexandrium_andersonii.AAC.1